MSSNKPAVVTTKNGKLEGFIENGLYVFKGIPYAAQPVGNLRWLPPQTHESWSGIRPAKKYGAISPQNVMPLAANVPGMPDFSKELQDEGCLYLNVWTPGLDDAHRPVVFWIHGGAFIIGAGTEPFLEEGRLAKRGDVVIVSINYRMGAFGFMNLKEITGGKIPATGNEGLLDQIAALDWVHDNIAAFGGDPDNVIAAGFSAGAMSIGCLLGVPAARGKFHKTINRSGSTNTVAVLDNAVEITGQFLKLFNLDGKDTAALRALTTEQLLDGQQKMEMMLRETKGALTPFMPVVDGDVIPDFPIESIKKGSAKNVIVMAGNTLDELKISTGMDPAMRNLDEAGLLKRLERLLPADLIPEAVKVYREALKKRGSSGTPLDVMGTISTDMMFRIPTLRLVEAQRDNGTPSYNYYFTYKSPAMGGILGAMHGLDNPFLFGYLDPDFTGSGPEAESLAVKIQDSCIAFAHNGNPSCKAIGEWPVYGKDRMTMILDKNARVETAPYEAERRVWDGYEFKNTLPM
ncbi:MAG: carboxylesterase/lipase family protein [Dehalococcoidales bacterium]|nr:carboxylesterase/lipase family protein [Dehalococcoidales bacterium]